MSPASLRNRVAVGPKFNVSLYVGSTRTLSKTTQSTRNPAVFLDYVSERKEAVYKYIHVYYLCLSSTVPSIEIIVAVKCPSNDNGVKTITHQYIIVNYLVQNKNEILPYVAKQTSKQNRKGLLGPVVSAGQLDIISAHL